MIKVINQSRDLYLKGLTFDIPNTGATIRTHLKNTDLEPFLGAKKSPT